MKARALAAEIRCLPVILGLVAAGLLGSPAAAIIAPGGDWQLRGSETIRLEAGESFQFRVKAEEIPLRSWRLVVQADQILSDVHVMRARDKGPIYFEARESVHDVLIPWGNREEVSVVVTARSDGGVYDILFLGPAADTAPICYSYQVNRALEAYAVGKRIEAESLCHEALREDPYDGVAKVMLAGFLRDRHFYEQAAAMVDEALGLELPSEMNVLARQLQDELVVLRAPLPREIREGLETVEKHLADGRGEEALQHCDEMLLARDMDSEARSRILLYRGQALHDLERGFAAVDAYTKALTFARSRRSEAIIYFRMGQLFLEMGNAVQAEGAFTIAVQSGLPIGLNVKAVEALDRIAREKE